MVFSTLDRVTGLLIALKKSDVDCDITSLAMTLVCGGRRFELVLGHDGHLFYDRFDPVPLTAEDEPFRQVLSESWER